MDAAMRDRIFGTGRGPQGLRGVFAPPGVEPAQRGDILASYRGPGRDKVLGFLEQRNFITAEQRAAGGSTGAAAGGVDELAGVLGGTTRGLTGATAAATAGSAAVEYANPVYGGLYAQQLMRDQGFVAPTAAPVGAPADVVDGAAGQVRALASTADDGAAAAVAATDSPIAAAADDVAARVVDMEQRMLGALQRLGDLPQPSKVPALQKAIDATAAHGGDTYDVLSSALLQRPLDDATVGLERALDELDQVAKLPVADDAAKVAAPLVDDAAKVAAAAAPLVDDVVATAVPRVVELAVPEVVAAAQPRLLPIAGDDALRGVMSFSAGIDDTLRLLAKF